MPKFNGHSKNGAMAVCNPFSTKTEGFDELLGWIEDGTIHLLSLNDHVPSSADEQTLSRHMRGLRRRVKLSEPEIRALVERAIAQRERGAQQIEELVKRSH